MTVILKDKKILITGASGGIGTAIVQHMAHDSSNVICVSGSNAEKLSSLVKLHSESKAKIFPIECNLSNLEEAGELVGKASELMSGIDCLVCNAGIKKDNLSIRMSIQDWQQVIDVNLTANFLINRSACHLMLKSKTQGSIVNVSSVVGMMGNPGQANYAASKGGLISMSKSLAKEYAAKGIRVNCVAPGFIETPMTAYLTQDKKEAVLNQIPMRRIGKPEEAAGPILWLLSDSAGYVTGQVISPNGGLLI